MTEQVILDAGILKVYSLNNIADKGLMPVYKLEELSRHYYGERLVTYARHYAALGANQQVDKLVRVRFDETIRIGMYCILEDELQYRVDNVQHLFDEDGLKVTELTLYRMGELYDITE